MEIQVRLFATLRDRAGSNSLSIDVPDGATVRALLDALATQHPSLRGAVDTALVAVNEEYAFPEDSLADGDNVALFPPVSGGSETGWPEYFAVTPDPLDLNEITAHITRPDTGAVAVFSGAVRGVTRQDGEPVATNYLYYEAYEPMAEKMLHLVANEIRAQYPKVQGIAIVQRIGRLEIGEVTILVACSSGHRHDGIFEAARYGIDRVKEIVPVWKKEFGADGDFWVEGPYRPTPADGQASTRAGNSPGEFVIGCLSCNEQYLFNTPRYLCKCGQPLEMIRFPAFNPGDIDRTLHSMWRYASFLAPRGLTPVTMGEGWTPLVEAVATDRKVYLKLEGLNPSGSFKDRGASLLVSLLRNQGITVIHDDSSGNAGAALAAYAACAGLRARLYVPAYASPVKLAQIDLYGAELYRVAGPRGNAAKAAQNAAEESPSFYASHIHHPFAVWGFTSIAYEIWEQLGQQAPEAVVVPLGHGAQLLGIARGFQNLLLAGVIAQLPRLYGVQSAQCSPLWQKLHNLNGSPTEGETIAEGIRISHPVRADAIIAAVRDTKGDIIAVEEHEIIEALLQLGRRGISAEPTSAVVWAALPQITPTLSPKATVVLSISGSGLKTPQLDILLQKASDKRHSM